MTEKGSLKYTKEEIIDDVLNVYNKYGYIDIPLYKKVGKYGEYQIWKHFGGIKNLHNKKLYNEHGKYAL